MITHHTQLLQALIDKYNLKSYLEIGIFNPANNFDFIKCDFKQGIDPVCSGKGIYSGKSDAFFAYVQMKSMKWDLIFIDGDHTAEQVKRDFENSLKCLSDKGFIVIHDCLPENEVGTKVPRETKIWWGSVYKFAMNIHQYPDINFKTFNIDNGCMLVWKEKDYLCLPKANAKPYSNDWTSYLQYRDLLMNVVEEVEI